MSRATTRRLKVVGILARGLVLGIGAAYTLAWSNDSEFASGDFTAGTFVFEGAADGADFDTTTRRRGRPRRSRSRRPPTTSRQATSSTRRMHSASREAMTRC